MKKVLFFVMALLLGHIAFATATLPGNWRWRHDDGTEVTATWSAAESTPLTLSSIASPIRLRLSSYSNTLSGTDVGVLQYTADPSAAADPGNVSATFNTAWTTIPTSGTGAAFTTSASSVIGSAVINPTTPQLSQSTGHSETFAGGSLFTTTNGASGTVTANRRYEIEFTIKPTVRIANSTTYYFRVYATGNGQAPATANYLDGVAHLVTAANISPIIYPGGVGSGLKLWLKANKDIMLATGTNVSTWYDQSGGINDVSQATAGSQPTKVDGSINFNPSLNFNTAYLVNSGGALGNTSYTGASIFIVNKEVTRTNSYTVYQVGTGSYVGLVAPWSDGNAYFGYGPGQTTGAASGIAVGTANLFSGISTNTPSNSQRINVNGTQVGSFTNNPSYTASFGDLGIGGIPNGTGLYNGNISEVIMYSRGLTTAEEQQVNGYQAIKYGLTLSTNYLSSASTVLWNATANVTYKNNIAAIGRDDLSALYQNQSQSENNGTQVTVAICTAATTNQLNVTNATTDQQFLIWGDDATSMLPVTTTGVVAAPNRITRVWKTQNTNTFAQQLTVYYPTIYFASPYLIYGSSAASLSNGTASLIANSGTVTVNGVSNYAFTVPAATVGSIGFFSFAGIVLTPGGVAGAALWVKADDATVNVTPTTWVNQIGGTDLTGSGTNAFSNATTNLVNFNPSVVFNGTNSRYDAATSFMPNGTTTFDAFVATKCVAAPGTASLFYFGDQSAPTTATNRVQFHYPFGAGTNSIFDFNSTGTGTSPTNARLITTPMFPAVGTSGVITAHFDNGTNGQYIAVNGNIPAASFKQTVGTGKTFNGTTNNTFTMGRYPQTPTFYNGNVQEMIAFGSTTILTQLQRKQVESYLAIKYGQTIGKDDNFNTINGETISGAVSEGDYVASDGSTITWNYSTVGTSYQNNIAGIGRDDNTALNQLQSRSENTASKGNMITMGLGTITTTNQLNSGTINTDKSFNIWGDDGTLATTSTQTNLPAGVGTAGCAVRLTRQWKLQRTGTGVGAVQVNVDMNSTISLTGLTVNDFDLVIDNDGDGNFATGTITAIPATSYTGGVITFNGVNWDADASGSDVFTVVVNKSVFSPNPVLVTANSLVLAPLATCLTSSAYLQFIDVVGVPTKKYLQINPNGNTGYSFTATVTNNSPVLSANNNRKTDGASNTTALSARMYTIVNTGGTTSFPTGMSVRIYYSAADSIAAVAGLDPVVTSGSISTKWFKLPGTVANVLVAQTTTGITGATYLTPSAYGSENGINYVEFSGITNFSTFGFVAKRGTFVLPVTFTSVTANAVGCAATINWTTATESNSNHYEVEASVDGNTFTKIGTVISKNSAAGATYSFTANASGITYYKLKAVDNDGNFTFSQIVAATTNCNNSSVSVSPNPTSNLLQVQGIQSGSHMQLFTANGKQLTEVIATGTSQTISMSMYAKGIYILRIQAANGNISNLKVVKE